MSTKVFEDPVDTDRESDRVQTEMPDQGEQRLVVRLPKISVDLVRLEKAVAQLSDDFERWGALADFEMMDMTGETLTLRWIVDLGQALSVGPFPANTVADVVEVVVDESELFDRLRCSRQVLAIRLGPTSPAIHLGWRCRRSCTGSRAEDEEGTWFRGQDGLKEGREEGCVKREKQCLAFWRDKEQCQAPEHRLGFTVPGHVQ